jgi:hypothetical protein
MKSWAECATCGKHTLKSKSSHTHFCSRECNRKYYAKKVTIVNFLQPLSIRFSPRQYEWLLKHTPNKKSMSAFIRGLLDERIAGEPNEEE